ncbi:MAG: hypothetical protein E7440_07595 [Ruminococcaceae bacterium]|nr:hypothetical protein [Oscillospiraceae bacterium]
MRRVIPCVLLVGMLSGCGGRSLLPYAREMGDSALVRVVGVDTADGGTELTVSTGSRQASESALVLSARGETLPEAALAVQSLGDSYVYYGYADQLVIGEEQAMTGLEGLMDWLARESQLGLGMQLWVVREGTAAQAVWAGGTRGTAERLSQLNTDSEVGAASMGCTAAQMMSVLAREGSTYLPAVVIAQKREGDGGEGQAGTPLPSGYGVIRKGKLVCWTDDDTARGVELMEEQVFGHAIHLKLDDGAVVGVRLEGARTRVEPVFREGALSGLDVRCDVTARIVQTQRRLEGEDMERLQNGLEQMVGERMVRALELGQYWDADYLDLKRRTQLARPDKKAEIGAQWESAYRALTVRVDVRGTMERSFGM